jgi:hypothetical protein
VGIWIDIRFVRAMVDAIRNSERARVIVLLRDTQRIHICYSCLLKFCLETLANGYFI